MTAGSAAITGIPFFHYSSVNTAGVTSAHNPHCTLIVLHMTAGSAAITRIAFCEESILVLSQLILYTDERPTAAHYPHVAYDF